MTSIDGQINGGLARFKSIGNAGMVNLARKGGKPRARALPRERLREIGRQAVRMREVARHLEREKKIEEIPGKFGITACDSTP